MSSIVINWADGSIDECIDLDEAETTIERRYGEVVYCDQWDADGVNDDDEPMERLLFWRSEEDAENDSGAKALGYLSRLQR